MPPHATTDNGLGRLSGAAPVPQPTLDAIADAVDVTAAPAVPSDSVAASTKHAKAWSYMVAGAVGSLAAATATAPFDVIRTRLQSDFYQQQLRARQQVAATAAAAAASTATNTQHTNPIRAVGRHLSETMQIFVSVQRTEGWRALFKGLGPTLVGTVPAKSINFYTYGNGKRLISETAGVSQDTPWVHLAAGVVAGVVTSTATNPIWLIKTRMQLDREAAATAATTTTTTTATAAPAPESRRYRNSIDCVRQVLRQEGIRGLYKGLTASYLGAAESTTHWLLYEQLKRGLARRAERRQQQLALQSSSSASAPPSAMSMAWDHFVEWTGPLGAAGAAKLCASLLTYPHEVVRTRLRQAPLADGRRKYTGLVQCFVRVWREEGVPGLYGGLTPHLLRTVPAAGITFGIYEVVLKLLN